MLDYDTAGYEQERYDGSDVTRASKFGRGGMCKICIWAYLPAVFGFAYITNLQNLAQNLPAFLALAADEDTSNIWNAMVGSLALQLFTSFVPSFFVCIFWFCFVLKAQARLQHRMRDVLSTSGCGGNESLPSTLTWT